MHEKSKNHPKDTHENSGPISSNRLKKNTNNRREWSYMSLLQLDWSIIIDLVAFEQILWTHIG